MTHESSDELDNWQVPTECAKCGDVIYSHYNGEFRSCKCGAIAVDQTRYYARYIGNKEDFVGYPKDTQERK